MYDIASTSNSMQNIPKVQCKDQNVFMSVCLKCLVNYMSKIVQKCRWDNTSNIWHAYVKHEVQATIKHGKSTNAIHYLNNSTSIHYPILHKNQLKIKYTTKFTWRTLSYKILRKVWKFFKPWCNWTCTIT